jgi:hypothetical protein
MKITISHQVVINHEKFGIILEEVFTDAVQFKIFLSAVHGCLELKNDLDFFDGRSFLIHIPYKHLKSSIITTKIGSSDLSEHYISKLETLQTK